MRGSSVYGVVGPELLRCRPHLRTQSMVPPRLIICIRYSAMSRGQTISASIA